MENLPVEQIIQITKYLQPKEYLNFLQTSGKIWGIIANPFIRVEILKNKFNGNIATLLLFLYDKGDEDVLKTIFRARKLNSSLYQPQQLMDLEPIFLYLIEHGMTQQFIELWNTYPAFAFSTNTEQIVLRRALDCLCSNSFLKFLIKKGIKLNERPKVLLFTTICDGNLDKLKILINAGISMEGYHTSMLEISSLNKCLSIFKYLIEECEFNLELGFSDYLANTCLNQDELFFEYLLSKKKIIDISLEVINRGFLCLFQGLQRKVLSKDILEKLIKMGADVNIQGSFALETSIRRNSIYLVKYLIKKGATIHHGTDDGDLFSIACKMGNERIIRLLLQNGANPWSYGALSVKYLIQNQKNKLLAEVLQKNENYPIDWRELIAEAHKALNFEGATIIWKNFFVPS